MNFSKSECLVLSCAICRRCNTSLGWLVPGFTVIIFFLTESSQPLSVFKRKKIPFWIFTFVTTIIVVLFKGIMPGGNAEYKICNLLRALFHTKWCLFTTFTLLGQLFLSVIVITVYWSSFATRSDQWDLKLCSAAQPRCFVCFSGAVFF